MLCLFSRRVRSIVFVCLALCVLPLAAGCQHKAPPQLNYAQELAPGEKALRKIEPAQYPDFSGMGTRPAELARSIDNSLLYLGKPSSQEFFPYLDISHDRAVATLRAMRQALDAAPGGAVDWNRVVRDQFEVYQSIGAPAPDGRGYSRQVLFTGYCTPIYDASLTRTGKFQWPIYKRPADLLMDGGGEGMSRQTPDAPRNPLGVGAKPYYTRAEIEGQGKLAGQELLWLKSRWEAYVVTIQGSARLKLPDGRIMEVGFAGTNGQPYVSPGKQMVADKVITKEQFNFSGLRRYFDEHPEQMDHYLWLNPRTVFFAERPGGPYGKLNVPVTAFATIATDKDVYPRSMPAFAMVPIPSAASGQVTPAPNASTTPPGTIPFHGFLLDQDAGGAIRAAGRCDIYMGIGPQAENMAGHQVYPGQLYYIALKPQLVPQFAGPKFASAQ